MIGKQNKNVNFLDSYVFDNLLPEKYISNLCFIQEK